MRKESPLFVKVEQEKNESNLSSFGAIPTFLEFLNGFKFDRMVGATFKDKSNQGYSSFHHILTLILLNLTGGQSVSDVERLEEDSGLKRVFKRLEKKLNGLKGRIFRKGRTRVFPSASCIFNFLDCFNSDAEEAERESTPEGKSKILPVADSFKELVELNRSIVCQSQVLSPRQTATLDMDNNLIVTNKSTAKTSYKKDLSYHPFNVYWAEQDLMLFSEFRDGNVPAGKEQLKILKESLSLLPAGRFPSGSFGENAAGWYLSIISLNLLKLFQRHTLPKELKQVRLKTLNARLFRIAVKAREGGRQLIVKIGRGHSLFELTTCAQNKILKLDEKLSS